MRVASWLKCPDCKLQRNSEPLLKLNSCRKEGKKNPRFLGQVSIAPPFKSLPSNAPSGSSPHFAVEFDQLISQRRSLMSPERQTFKSLPTIHRYLATLLDFQTASHAFTAPFFFKNKNEQSFVGVITGRREAVYPTEAQTFRFISVWLDGSVRLDCLTVLRHWLTSVTANHRPRRPTR